MHLRIPSALKKDIDIKKVTYETPIINEEKLGDLKNKEQQIEERRQGLKALRADTLGKLKKAISSARSGATEGKRYFIGDKFINKSVNFWSTLVVAHDRNVYSTSYANAPSNETFIRHKAKRSHVVVSKEVIPKIKSADIVGSHFATYEGLNANSSHESITSAQDGANASNMETKRCPPKKSHMLIK
nr:ubiquitin carboxyl-terminal hydrolase 15-like isoform X1 [Tanacetum cinerariifolium]